MNHNLGHCQYPSCKDMAQYSIYEFYPDFTKRWVHVCDKHDKFLALANGQLRVEFPDKIFKEVKNSV